MRASLRRKGDAFSLRKNAAEELHSRGQYKSALLQDKDPAAGRLLIVFLGMDEGIYRIKLVMIFASDSGWEIPALSPAWMHFKSHAMLRPRVRMIWSPS